LATRGSDTAADFDVRTDMMHENGNSQLLTSWKEIAAHLGKGVRTVQRWERELGLPVRRPAKNRHIVVALPVELNGWIAQLVQPSSAACCSCYEDLQNTRRTIADLHEQIATLQSELNAAMLALQVSANVSQIAAESSQCSTSSRMGSDGTAA
jgi:hypothetical protein